MDLLVLILGILLLLVLIIKFKFNTYVSLIITAVVVALGLGMAPAKIATSIQTGIGSQLGELALVFGFGAMLGRLVADAGGAYRIAHTLINAFGRRGLQLAVVLASFIIGIALFFEVGIVLLVPIVFAIAAEAGVPILTLGIPMAAALSVTHGFLPPHPAPTAISTAHCFARLSCALLITRPPVKRHPAVPGTYHQRGRPDWSIQGDWRLRHEEVPHNRWGCRPNPILGKSHHR